MTREGGRSCPTSAVSCWHGTGKPKCARHRFQPSLSLGQLTAEHDFKFLQDVKTHTKTQRSLPNILERVLEEPARAGSAATKDTLLGLGRGGMGPTVHPQVTIKCIHSPVQGTTVQCPSLTLLQVSNKKKKKNEVKQN